MNLLLQISGFTAQLFVAGLWQGLVLISATAICLRLLPRLNAAVRFAVWGFAFALVVMTPLLRFFRSPSAHQSTASSPVLHVSADWGYAIAAVWVILMSARSLRILAQAIRLHRIWMRTTPVATQGTLRVLLQRGSRIADLCTSTDVDSPSVIGFFSPRLLIPEWLFAKLTEQELRQIVLHECEHLRRRDDWLNLLQKVGLALFPLNPALLWVDRRLSLERELACDATVVALTASPFDYAHCLARLAEHRLCRRVVALTLSAWSRESELARRVHNLLRPVGKMSRSRAMASVALLGLALAGGAVKMAQLPRFISFSPETSAPVSEVAETALRPVEVRALPVAYDQSAEPHATLLKAVLPESKAHRIISSSRSVSKRQGNAELHPVPVARVRRRPRLLLTAATEPSASMPSQEIRCKVVRATYLISTQFSTSYAAVQFEDGWLIVQL
jgi:beta-lactamase regulating signal transducer with metallopeptidase domain